MICLGSLNLFFDYVGPRLKKFENHWFKQSHLGHKIMSVSETVCS